MNDVVWTHRPALRRPVLVAAFGGWNDAADAASAAVEFIRARFEPTEVARIELEDYLDFTETRPTARLVDSHTREIDWPVTTIAAAEVPGADNDLVIVQGPEPALRWRRYCDTVVAIAQELGVRRVVTLGSLLADVPHTRPVHITGIGSDTAMLDRLGFSPTSYEGPTGITGVLNYEAGLAGLPSVSLWASVPHYVAAAPPTWRPPPRTTSARSTPPSPPTPRSRRSSSGSSRRWTRSPRTTASRTSLPPT